ncbi:AAA family ATPase [Halonatronum saccharophilum]|uniref:AAA family ATPase n=1 Tax=Halonatronum saccharophilum TaxID=150060 RepID=UPI0004B4DDD0|nr:ATP-binding protein [Halonatronum saccharophilum]
MNKANNNPSLIFMVGVAGSGKSTVGEVLAEKLNYTYLDKNALTRVFTEKLLEVNGLPTWDRESEFYLANIRPYEYQILMDVAEENLKLGNDVILSAPFLKEIQDENWLEEEVRSKRDLKDIDIKVVHVLAGREAEKRRLTKRNTPRDTWKLKNWDIYSKDIDGISMSWPEEMVFNFYNQKEVKDDNFLGSAVMKERLEGIMEFL